MTTKLQRVFCAGLLAFVLAPGIAGAGVKDPIEGDAFHALVAAQDVELQQVLETAAAGVTGDNAGTLVTGPMDPFFEGDGALEALMHASRVVCSHAGIPGRLVEALRRDGRVEATTIQGDGKRGLCGIRAAVEVDGDHHDALFLTENENRWLVWVRDVNASRYADVGSEAFREYALAVSDYLHGLRADPSREAERSGECPEATAYALAPEASFYPPRPPYVIQGYDNYKDFLYSHEDVYTPFASGVLGFVPGDSLRGAMAGFPPETAWPNKEEPLIQHEYREFFARGGNTAALRTLTAEMVSGLEAGEYFYCVGLSGRIRFGYEIPREEAETGKKVARANHAFLFPGEPVLTAGAFFVRDGAIVEADAHSGHYFYSNITATIRDDIARRSDEYLMTLGHFLAALERLGVDTRGVLMSKM